MSGHRTTARPRGRHKRDISRRSFLSTAVGAVAAQWAIGCNSTTTGPGSTARLSSRPGLPTQAPTSGLTPLGLDEPRDGLLYVPQGYSPDTPAPLFVGMHGASGAASDWQSYPARADERGMVLLLPDSREYTWDVLLGGFGPDVTFLDRALEHTFARCRIDPQHIALAGFSDGASYALSLGAANGDLFSHLIGYSPGFFVEPDPAVGKPPVFISHGTSDPVLPVRASRDLIVPHLRDQGYDVTYEEFDGGHEVPSAISEAALDWFLGAA